MIGKVNACLKTLGDELELDKKLTTYVARHSYATTLKRAGVSTSLICDALGHSSERVTQIYLDSFENTQLKAAMKNLLWTQILSQKFTNIGGQCKVILFVPL